MMAAAPAAPPASTAPPRELLIALTGNPNCGKTTLFNALTGLRARVGNYAGVTVERKEGRLRGTPPHLRFTLLDLPGCYSLNPQSLDEAIARDVLLRRLADVPSPSAVIVVVDASNLERNLYYATQVIELGYPTVVALNMTDVAHEHGIRIDPTALAEALGVPVIPLVASRREGIDKLRAEVLRLALYPASETAPLRREFVDLPAALERERRELGRLVGEEFPGAARPDAEALLLLSDGSGTAGLGRYPSRVLRAVDEARTRLRADGVDWSSAAIEGRYGRVAGIHARVSKDLGIGVETLSDRLDRLATHRIWGVALFVGLMFLMFQSIFTFAETPMGWIEGGVGWLGERVQDVMPPGDLRDLLTQGVITGVGAVIVFLPQILLLFLFISLLEDTGYMARAAFLMDRLMSKVGLHGKSFIPLLSSFACAIPGIMATRTIETPKDRLVTILVAPLMSCSARLPVYTVLIAACIPNVLVLGFLKLSALTLLGVYLLGITAAFFSAWLFKRTLLKGPPPLLILELPPYRRPRLRTVLRQMWDRSMIFVRRAGTVILVINMILWVLATYPRPQRLSATFEQRRAAPAAPAVDRGAHRVEVESDEAGERLRQSFAGMLGRAIEPVIKPLGFDWKIGIGLIASFAAREVFVSTMSTVYSVGEFDDSGEGMRGLADVLQAQKRPDGRPLYTPLTGVTLMVFFVFALQCVSTVAVVRRETNSWRWPLFQLAYMTGLAWLLAFATYNLGRLMGMA
jgi:ferrous iron transport protein B